MAHRPDLAKSDRVQVHFDSSSFDIRVGLITFSSCRLLGYPNMTADGRRLRLPTSTKPRTQLANRLLDALPVEEYQRIRPHLTEFSLVFGEVLYERGAVIRHVYFPNGGVVSLISMVEPRSTLEVGMVGNEGLVGLSVFLGAPRFHQSRVSAGRGFGDENVR